MKKYNGKTLSEWNNWIGTRHQRMEEAMPLVKQIQKVNPDHKFINSLWEQMKPGDYDKYRGISEGQHRAGKEIAKELGC